MMSTHYFTPYGDSDPTVRISTRTINVDSDVIAVEVEAVVNGFDYYFAKAASRRHPEDKQDSELGTKLAVGRAIRQIGRDILRDAQERVRENDKALDSQKQASEDARKKKEQRTRQIRKQLKAS
jgi:hypothetical protein